jgi:endonuclease G, mitochondrial
MSRTWPFFVCALLLVACKKDTEQSPAPAPPVVADDGRDDHLALGNPSNATVSLLMPDNYLMQKAQFALAYTSSRGTARWVAWHLSTAWKGTAERCDCFGPDWSLPSAFYQTNTWNYTNTGFDRGHMCPSDDRDGSDVDNAVTFLMTNIMPQAPQLNQGIWAELEDYARSLAFDGNELYIFSGGYGSGGTGSQGGTTTTIAGGAITVPARYWKVLVVLPVGSNDLSRVSTSTRVIAIDLPNTQAASALPWGSYRTSVDALESSTGLDFLSLVPASVQEAVEGVVDDGPTQ